MISFYHFLLFVCCVYFISITNALKEEEDRLSISSVEAEQEIQRRHAPEEPDRIISQHDLDDLRAKHPKAVPVACFHRWYHIFTSRSIEYNGNSTIRLVREHEDGSYSFGSGILVSCNGYVLTSAKFVPSVFSLRAVTLELGAVTKTCEQKPNQQVQVFRILPSDIHFIHSNPKMGYTLLRINNNLHSHVKSHYTYAQIRRGYPKIGNRIYLTHSPNGNFISVSIDKSILRVRYDGTKKYFFKKARVSYIFKNPNDANTFLFNYDMNVSPTSVGGGIFSKTDHRLLGIHVENKVPGAQPDQDQPEPAVGTSGNAVPIWDILQDLKHVEHLRPDVQLDKCFYQSQYKYHPLPF